MTERSVETSIIRLARKIVFKPRPQHHVMFNTKACRHRSVEPRALSMSPQNILEARWILDMNPNRQFYIHVSDCSDREVWLPKDIKIAQTTEPSSIIQAIDTNDREASPIGTPRQVLISYSTLLTATWTWKLLDKQTCQRFIRKPRNFKNHKISRHTAFREAFSQNVQDY